MQPNVATLPDFTISRESLQAGLANVAASIPAKSILPALACVMIEATPDGLWFTGTDLDMAVRAFVPADVRSEGACLLPAKKLSEIARELPAAPVAFTFTAHQAAIKCGRSRFKLNTVDVAEFPTLPTVDWDEAWTVPGGELSRLITHTSFATSTEESRPILNGVLWELRPSSMAMVATNGHRLARMEIATTGHATADLIIPPAALAQVRKVIGGADVEVARGGNHLAFRTPDLAIYTRLIEGPYPNYRQVIPTDNENTAIVDRAALTSALKRISVVASDQTHRIKLTFAPDTIKMAASTPDQGEASDDIAATYNGAEMEVGFNASYLLEVLRYMPTELVRISLKAPERAVTVEPEGWDDPAQYLTLVMPLRLVD